MAIVDVSVRCQYLKIDLRNNKFTKFYYQCLIIEDLLMCWELVI